MGQKTAPAETGDTPDLVELYLSHTPRLRRRIADQLRLNPFVDFSVDDVMQEVFLDIRAGISTFDERKGTLDAWVDAVARNRLARFIRDRSRVKRGGQAYRVRVSDDSILRLLNELPDESSETPSRRVSKDQAKQAVLVCVSMLESKERAVIEFRFFKEMSLDEMAQKLSLTKNAVRGVIYRAKQNLNELLGGSCRWQL